MTEAHSSIHACVFARTDSGRQALFDIGAELSQAQRRLLLMVNGETPFAALARLAPGVDQTEVVERLLDDGLITPAERSVLPHGRPRSWRGQAVAVV